MPLSSLSRRANPESATIIRSPVMVRHRLWSLAHRPKRPTIHLSTTRCSSCGVTRCCVKGNPLANLNLTAAHAGIWQVKQILLWYIKHSSNFSADAIGYLHLMTKSFVLRLPPGIYALSLIYLTQSIFASTL